MGNKKTLKYTKCFKVYEKEFKQQWKEEKKKYPHKKITKDYTVTFKF